MYFGLGIDFNASRTRRIYWNEYTSVGPVASVIRYVDENGTDGVYSGSASAVGCSDGRLETARWDAVWALAVDQTDGSIYVTQLNCPKIRRINGTHSAVVAGSGSDGCTGDGGPALSAPMETVDALVRDVDTGNIHFLQGAPCRRGRVLTPAGVVNSWVGVTDSSGVSGGDGGLASAATFNDPHGLAVLRDDSGVKNWIIAVRHCRDVPRSAASQAVSPVAGRC